MPKRRNPRMNICPRCNQKIRVNKLIRHMAEHHEVALDNQTKFTLKEYKEAMSVRVY